MNFARGRAEMTKRVVKIGNVTVGKGLALIAGPCVIESRARCLDLAKQLRDLAQKSRIPFIFKASYDKANRTSVKSFRGPGLVNGLEILAEVKSKFGVPVLTDVHSPAEVRACAGVVDVLQIPAFLCRQTDLLLAAGETGLPVNVKKGQFLAPWDMQNVIGKIESTGNRRILITERGTMFGYNNLVVDMRSLPILRDLGYPVVFDATHSVQKPGGGGDRTSGDACMAPFLARAAVACGCDAVFLETYRRPEQALSDGANAVPLKLLGGLWKLLMKIKMAVE
jgi:2-dehydro-3-deoxyphosphooctonate aldolase (KDO 8-P synthase)